MKWACRKRVRYWFLDYGEIAFVLTVLVLSAIIIVWMLVILIFFPPAHAAAGDIVNFRTAQRMAVPVLHSNMPVTRRSMSIATILCEISAYSPTVAECDSNPLITASGKRVYVGGVAADWGVLPCGSIVIILNYNNGKPCVVTDTGSAIRGNKLDVFFWHEAEAVQWGRRRSVKVQVLYVPKATQ